MYHTRTYNSARLPSMINYAYAKTVFKDAVPYRGRYPLEKPLGKNRRYDHMQIHQRIRSIEVEGDPLGKFATTYACQLYGTDCIEFYPDESIILRVNSWRGPTTMMFMNYTLQEHIGSVQSESGKWYFVNKGGEAFVMPTGKNEGLHMHFVDGHGFIPKDLKPEYKYKMSRKEMIRLRKYYSDFIEYGKTMLLADGKLGTHMEKQELLQEFGLLRGEFVGNHESCIYDDKGNISTKYTVVEERGKIMRLVERAMASNDLELKYKLLQVIGSNNARYSYRDQTYTAASDTFVAVFDEIIKYQHRDLIFEAIEQKIGVPFRDRNERYFS